MPELYVTAIRDIGTGYDVYVHSDRTIKIFYNVKRKTIEKLFKNDLKYFLSSHIFSWETSRKLFKAEQDEISRAQLIL